MIRKPDDSYRLCIDYRELNAVTIQDRNPLPDPTMWLAGLFLKVRPSLGVWQICMAEEDVPKTASFRSTAGIVRRESDGYGKAAHMSQRLLDQSEISSQHVFDRLLGGGARRARRPRRSARSAPRDPPPHGGCDGPSSRRLARTPLVPSARPHASHPRTLPTARSLPLCHLHAASHALAPSPLGGGGASARLGRSLLCPALVRYIGPLPPPAAIDPPARAVGLAPSWRGLLLGPPWGLASL
jgi:hypothetical protein